MATHIDPRPYLHFLQPDVAGAVFLAKMLLQRTPKASPPSVRKAASILEEALDVLRETWSRQSPQAARELRPLARRLGAQWSAIRTRLLACEALPEGHADRVRARSLHDLLFPEGLGFTQLAFSHLHCETERRLMMLEERDLEKVLARLVGAEFVELLRAAYEAAGDALGVNERIEPVVSVSVAGPLRTVVEAIVGYALQLLAVARLDPDKREAVAFALSPIDEYRASVRRAIARGDENDDAEDVDGAPDAVVTPLPTPSPVVLAPVA
jgi:hypothetical protein